jgi:hypothetical protein
MDWVRRTTTLKYDSFFELLGDIRVSTEFVGKEAENRDDLPFAGQDYNESIDTALTTIQESQIELSHLADSKANIMITVSSILLTLLVAQLEDGALVFSSLTFAFFCMLALIFAILCVMPAPNTSKKTVGKDGLLKNFNPLFFMHFTLLPMKKFEREIERVLTDPQALYQNLVHDIYHAGMVLRVKKFRYLRWSYISLLTGVVASVVVLLFEFGLRAE